MKAAELFAARLLIVTGKGGTGKTAVAAALGLAAAMKGHEVLLVEIEGREGLPRLFDLPALGHQELQLGERITGMAVDQKAALREYLDAAGVPLLGSLINRTGLADLVTAAAPGLGDALVLSRVWEAATRADKAAARNAAGGEAGGPAGGPDAAQGDAPRDGAGRAADRRPYGLVIVDAPPAGRAVPFLRAPGSLAGVARVGPAADRARLVAGLLTDPARTRAVVTALPEPLPITEARETATALREAGIALGLLVVNQVLPDGLGRMAARLPDLGRDPSPLLTAAGAADLPMTPATARALVKEATDLERRLDTQRRLLAELRDGLDADVVELPLLPRGAGNGEAIRTLARSLRRVGPRRTGAAVAKVSGGTTR
jgi:anion-transporting  ArsA/GET3 family ATPase